jgi:hypothetical protein
MQRLCVLLTKGSATVRVEFVGLRLSLDGLEAANDRKRAAGVLRFRFERVEAAPARVRPASSLDHAFGQPSRAVAVLRRRVSMTLSTAGV